MNDLHGRILSGVMSVIMGVGAGVMWFHLGFPLAALTFSGAALYFAWRAYVGYER